MKKIAECDKNGLISKLARTQTSKIQTFVDYGQQVKHQTGIKINISCNGVVSLCILN